MNTRLFSFSDNFNEKIIDEIEMKLDEADRTAKATPVRYTADEVFGRARSRFKEK